MICIFPTLVIAEATYFIGRRLGSTAESKFLSGMADLAVEPPTIDDFKRMGELVKEYANIPLGGTDASIVALAERLNITTIITLDRRHFSAIRPDHCDGFALLP